MRRVRDVSRMMVFLIRWVGVCIMDHRKADMGLIMTNPYRCILCKIN